MLKSHEKFHSSGGKRLLLVADDEVINRELLGSILEDEYEIIYAEDGQQTADQIREHKDQLSLVLLDIRMPVKSGIEVLSEMKDDPETRHIPVIVLTADQNAEVESLDMGASDYIPKPYPHRGIIHARIRRAIELSEDREIIQVTERDPLTGLYNREYFYRYAEQYDQHHRSKEMDALVVNINHFHMINERFGTAYGDDLLRRVGERIRESIADTEGIVCRPEADTFMVYCPHGVDYNEIVEQASVSLDRDESVNSRVRLRLGVYASVDKDLEVQRRFDRAKMAADTVRNNFNKKIGFYDNTLHERELYEEHLIEDYHSAIETGQFKVYLQPKFDVRPRTPVLSSAEALVRWDHPEFGLISPGVFIPLFEENGLIYDLDIYVWRKTCEMIKKWRERFGFSVPVSVNVSRVDMYDENFIDTISSVVLSCGLAPEDLLLEITESAYTEESEQIIETVEKLRTMGFSIEMDDFGTGYSSLNMISALPIDALKLDMQFIRSAFSDKRDTRMLELIIDIADHLSVPVIAEGVETEEQLATLRELGCDIVQGYYFSKPVPSDDFEQFLLERKEIPPEDLTPDKEETGETGDKGEKLQAKPSGRSLPLKVVNIGFTVLVFIIAAALVVFSIVLNRGYRKVVETGERHLTAVASADDLQEGSDHLTECVRMFVVTGDISFLDDYFEEANVTRRRERALEDMENLRNEASGDVYRALSEALETSDDLMEREFLAMRLTQVAFGYGDDRVPAAVSSVELSPDYDSMTSDEKKEEAQRLVFGEEYDLSKMSIRENVKKCTDGLVRSSDNAAKEARDNMSSVLIMQSVLLSVLALAVLGEVIFITSQVRKPLTHMVRNMSEQKASRLSGASELRFVAHTYNEFLEKSRKAHKKLSYEAFHDALTGLGNRSAYEEFMENADKEHLALLVIDVDDFKGVNDTYGHDVGDRVLKRVAEVLTHSFRSVDAVCRFGGDEFVVVMTRANSTMNGLVRNKIARANEILMNPTDDLPPISISVGVAFSDRKDPTGDVFKDADSALYSVKQTGKNGCAVYGEEEE